MKLYWFAWVSVLLSIFMYLIGSQDQMNDVVSSCQSKNQFVADGKEFVCMSKEEYFK